MDDARPSDGTPFPVEREFLLYAEVQEIMVFRLRFIGQAKELRQLFLLGFPQQAAEKRKRGRRNQGDPRVCQTLAGLPQGVPKQSISCKAGSRGSIRASSTSIQPYFSGSYSSYRR